MSSKVRLFTSDSHNPWFNLATEDWIFRDMDPSYRVMFLWRNSDTVVIGRHQNPWKECNLEKMEEDDVFLARRQSGGGAVYQDLGNTNFTFMTSSDQYDQEENFSVIIDAISDFGITAERSGRNDILVDGRKISGSAFKHRKDRSFHHGTLLISADLGRLIDYLSPSKKKLMSKGIDSVRSRVANLTEFNENLTHETLQERIFARFLERYNASAEVEHLTREDLEAIPSLRSHYEELKDWNWRFGKTPDFSHHLYNRFDWGEMDVHIDTKRGQIEEVKIFSDILYPDLVDGLEQKLVGVRYDKAAVQDFFARAQDEMPDRAEMVREFGDWMTTEI